MNVKAFDGKLRGSAPRGKVGSKRFCVSNLRSAEVFKVRSLWNSGLTKDLGMPPHHVIRFAAWASLVRSMH